MECIFTPRVVFIFSAGAHLLVPVVDHIFSPLCGAHHHSIGGVALFILVAHLAPMEDHISQFHSNGGVHFTIAQVVEHVSLSRLVLVGVHLSSKVYRLHRTSVGGAKVGGSVGVRHGPRHCSFAAVGWSVDSCGLEEKAGSLKSSTSYVSGGAWLGVFYGYSAEESPRSSFSSRSLTVWLYLQLFAARRMSASISSKNSSPV